MRYWFDTTARERSGEHVSEIIEADGAQAVVQRVREFMKEDTFVITPSFGPASAGFVVVQTRAVRYVEVMPTQTPGASPTGFATTTMDLPRR